MTLTLSLQGFLLVGLLIFFVIGLAVWISRQKVPRWVAPSVSLVTGVALVAVLYANWRFIVFGLAEWALDVSLNNGSLLLLTAALIIVPVASAVWMIRTSTDKGVLAIYLTGVLLWTGLTFFPARYLLGMVMFERAISSALNGQIDPDNQGRFSWECRWGCDDMTWLRDVPQVSDVRCVQRLTGRGACCQVYYPDEVYSEVHAFKLQGGKYKISFYSWPMCKNPDFVWPPPPGSPRIRQWIRCDERWRSNLDEAALHQGTASS
jgi:hypothetical protein